MDGCFSVYVLNTTEALFLFFKQRNLQGGGFTAERSRNRKQPEDIEEGKENMIDSARHMMRRNKDNTDVRYCRKLLCRQKPEKKRPKEDDVSSI